MEVLSVLAGGCVKIGGLLCQIVKLSELFRPSAHGTHLEKFPILGVVELEDDTIVSIAEKRSGKQGHMGEINASSPPYVVGISSQIGQRPGMGLLFLRLLAGFGEIVVHTCVQS